MHQAGLLAGCHGMPPRALPTTWVLPWRPAAAAMAGCRPRLLPVMPASTAVPCRLRLQDCANTTIGSSLARGISGGGEQAAGTQWLPTMPFPRRAFLWCVCMTHTSLPLAHAPAEAKRVSVGLTMITCPAVLLCDEPTSGLDSWNQHAVVEGGRAWVGLRVPGRLLGWVAWKPCRPWLPPSLPAALPPPRHAMQRCATWRGAASRWHPPSTPPPLTPLRCLTECSSCSAGGRCTLARTVGGGLVPFLSCCAIPCFCHAVLCRAMPCHAPCLHHHAMPRHAMPCPAMLRRAPPCRAMPCRAMPCHAMPCHAMPCHDTSLPPRLAAHPRRRGVPALL